MLHRLVSKCHIVGNHMSRLKSSCASNQWYMYLSTYTSSEQQLRVCAETRIHAWAFSDRICATHQDHWQIRRWQTNTLKFSVSQVSLFAHSLRELKLCNWPKSTARTTLVCYYWAKGVVKLILQLVSLGQWCEPTWTEFSISVHCVGHLDLVHCICEPWIMCEPPVPWILF